LFHFIIVFFVGLAPAAFLSDDDLTVNTCGFHCAEDLELYGESGGTDVGVPFTDGEIKRGSVVQLRLHRDKTFSIVVDGEDLGVAFRNVNTLEPLYLMVGMWSVGDCVELLPEVV
jgi:hypothetical protein